MEIGRLKNILMGMGRQEKIEKIARRFQFKI
jgi:hypothetical protein